MYKTDTERAPVRAHTNIPYIHTTITRHKVDPGGIVTIDGYTFRRGERVRVDCVYRYYLPNCNGELERMLDIYRRYQRRDDAISDYIADGVRTYHKLSIVPYYTLDDTSRRLLYRYMLAAMQDDPRYHETTDELILTNNRDTLDLICGWLETVRSVDMAKIIRVNEWLTYRRVAGVTDDISYYLGSVDPLCAAALDMLCLDVSPYRVALTLVS